MDTLVVRRTALRFIQIIGRQLRRVFGIVVLIAITAIGVAAMSAAAQAGRNETRPADVAVVWAATLPRRETLLHVIELYRRGLVDTILPIGEQAAVVRVALGEAGVPPEAFVILTSAVPPEHMAAATAATLRDTGDQQVLLVTTPSQMLLGLKMLRDQGLVAYGSPPSGPSNDPFEYMFAGVDYWRYTLAIE